MLRPGTSPGPRRLRLQGDTSTPPPGSSALATFSPGHLGQTQAFLPRLPVPETSRDTGVGSAPLLSTHRAGDLSVLGTSPAGPPSPVPGLGVWPESRSFCALRSGWGKG